MFKDLKPYPQRRDAGLPWLRQIPSGWDLVRAKSFLRPVDIRSRTGDEELLTVSSARGVVPRRGESVSMFAAASYVGHKLCWPDDLVINSLWAWGHGLGVTPFHGIVSSAYGVYRPDTRRVHPQFLHALVRSEPFQWELQVRSQGVWKSRLQLTDDRFFAAPVPLPPYEEQAAIVKYLGHAHRRIDRAIAAKRKMIALLEEQKQAIINQAVTRGLDTTVPLVDTGIPWLGQIPAHWEVAPVGSLASMVQTGPFGSQLHAEEYVTGGIPVINPSHIGPRGIRGDAAVTVTEEKATELSRHRLSEGDVIAARRGELGRCAVVEREQLGWLCGTGSLLIRPRRDRIVPAYLQVRFSSDSTRAQLGAQSVGATMANLNAPMVARLRLSLPSLIEQMRIIDVLNRQEDVERHRREVVEREIGVLREFRTRLTADVVMGQLDVRRIAARLPELGPDDLVPGLGDLGDDLEDEAAELMEDVET